MPGAHRENPRYPLTRIVATKTSFAITFLTLSHNVQKYLLSACVCVCIKTLHELGEKKEHETQITRIQNNLNLLPFDTMEKARMFNGMRFCQVSPFSSFFLSGSHHNLSKHRNQELWRRQRERACLFRAGGEGARTPDNHVQCFRKWRIVMPW